MLLLEFLKSILIDLSSEGPTAKIKDTIDELALQEIVDSFLARKKDKNGQYSISEEYDYEGLLSRLLLAGGGLLSDYSRVSSPST